MGVRLSLVPLSEWQDLQGRGANVFTLKRFRVQGDTLVWRPLTVNTHITLSKFTHTHTHTLSLNFTHTQGSCMCEKFHVSRCFRRKCKRKQLKHGEARERQGDRGRNRAGKIRRNFKFEYVFLTHLLLPLPLFRSRTISPCCLSNDPVRHLSTRFVFFYLFPLDFSLFSYPQRRVDRTAISLEIGELLCIEFYP